MTREEYDNLKPYQQGWITYCIANQEEAIPRNCPYRFGGQKASDWWVGFYHAEKKYHESFNPLKKMG